MSLTKSCAQCGKLFEKRKSDSLEKWNTRIRFCSKPCWYQWKTMQKKPAWNHGLTAKDHPSILSGAIKKKGINPFTKEQMKAQAERMRGTHHSEVTKQKMSQAHKNEKHWNWKGGITNEVHRLRQQMAYTHWKEQVHLRDADTCQHCGVQSATRKLDTHHLKAFKDYPDLRYEVSNGITLCGSCHTKEHARLKLLT